MGKTRRRFSDLEDYSVTAHRIPRAQVARIALAAQIDELGIETGPEPIELPGVDDGGGVARDRMLTLIQVAAEELTSCMVTRE